MCERDVGQRNRGNHAWLAGQQAFQPAIIRCVNRAGSLENSHSARDQECPDVALSSHLRGLPEPGFAARRVLLWHKPKRHARSVLSARRGKIAPAPEGGQVRGKCLDRKRRDRTHARHGLCAAHQAAFLAAHRIFASSSVTRVFRPSICSRYIRPRSGTSVCSAVSSPAIASASRLRWAGPRAATSPCSARWPRVTLEACFQHGALIIWVRWPTNICRVRNSIARAC